MSFNDAKEKVSNNDVQTTASGEKINGEEGFESVNIEQANNHKREREEKDEEETALKRSEIGELDEVGSVSVVGRRLRFTFVMADQMNQAEIVGARVLMEHAIKKMKLRHELGGRNAVCEVKITAF